VFLHSKVHSGIQRKKHSTQVCVRLLFIQSGLQVTVAEWLRRWTRNPMGFPRVGSNPARDVTFLKY
jgi:hypothetical protein